MIKLLNKTFKEIAFEFSMMVTFSTGVTAFYHMVLGIINEYKPHFNNHGLIYLILTSCCILIQSIYQVVQEKKSAKKVIPEFIDRIINIIGFTFMLVPTVLIINKIFGYTHILGDFKIQGVILSYFLSFLTFLIRTGLFHKDN
jgi:small-conductance mechanosensitive channel